MLKLRRRSLVSWLVLVAPGVISACSFFSPSLSEYALERPGVAGGGAAGQGIGGFNDTNAGASPVDAAGNSGAPPVGGGAGGTTGNAGDGGWVGVVEVGQSVSAADVTLQPVVSSGVPIFAAYTSYDIADATAATGKHDPPIYKPYESTTPSWWDNLVAEQTQARVPVILFPSHGVFSLDPKDMTGPDPMNPRQLASWVAAVNRAGASSLFRTACFIDPLSMQDVSNIIHGYPSGAIMDLSVQADWSDVFWLRGIKPLFDTIPKSYWLVNEGRPVIEMGALLITSFKNTSGNLSKLLTTVADQFHAGYGSYPAFVLDPSWFTAEATLSANPYVLGQNGLLKEDSGGRAFSTTAGLTFGTVLAGFADPGYYEASGPRFHDASLLIPRKIKDSDGSQVLTLATGLAAAVQNQSYLTVLQDFTGVKYWDGFYRSSGADWETPNEYLNLVRRYSDPQTVTLKLEAEGCDKFNDTTPGNSGTAFRRSGDLDVRALSANAGWVVTNTAAGEWVEFDKVDFSAGSYKFIAKHSTSGAGAGDKRIQLLIDGTPLKPIIAPESAGADTFLNTLLGEHFMAHGTHNIRVQFLDGLLDLDWLFVRKSDPVLSLKASNGLFVSALNGGGATLSADAALAADNEHITFDDLNGGSLTDGDQVYLQANNGLYLSVSASSSALTADQRRPSNTELFTVQSLSGGALAAGSSFALLTSDHYVTVGATGQLDGSGTSVGASQTFVVGGILAAAPVK